jgi:glutathione peroxidase
MKKYIFSGILALLMVPALLSAQKSFYDFSVTDIDGNKFDLSQLKGKKVLVVNTASKCGLTPQFEDLEKLYEEYRDRGLVIIGFPSNNFANQEPGTNDEIAEFCQKNYGVSFPMMSKISVKGDDIHPLYKWLTTEEENGVESSRVAWNFQKYMISEDGKLVGHVSPQKKPYNDEIINWLEGS